MAAKKVKLMVIGDSDACGGCRSEKEFISKNKAKLEKLGIDDVVFINPSKSDANEKIAEMYQKKHINGMKAQPLNVVVSGSTDVPFLGFSSSKFMGEIEKAVKSVKKDSSKSSKKSGKKSKKLGIFGRK